MACRDGGCREEGGCEGGAVMGKGKDPSLFRVVGGESKTFWIVFFLSQFKSTESGVTPKRLAFTSGPVG